MRAEKTVNNGGTEQRRKTLKEGVRSLARRVARLVDAAAFVSVSLCLRC